MNASAPRLALLTAPALAAMLIVGCGSSEEAGPLYAATVHFEPAAPVTGEPNIIVVKVNLLTGGPMTGGTVSVSSAGASPIAALALQETATPGSYRSNKLVFAQEGDYALSIAAAGPAGSETHNATVKIGCATSGVAGSNCCAPTACGKGLMCVFGTCTDKAQPDAAPCHRAAGCQSGVCTDNVCAAAACDDGVKNGGETDLDCGGSCASKCGGGLACASAADCKYGQCFDNKCGLAPGGLIGKGDGSPTSVKVTVILDNKLSSPSDLAFSSLDPTLLWVVNPPNDSMTVISKPGSDTQTATVLKDFSDHFLEDVMAIDFSDNGDFGTCGDTQNDYAGSAPPNNFMGPVLWPGKFSAYATVQSAHQVHGDMLHSSPSCMGIAAAGNNTYYTFNGYNGSIDWYDFGKPHVPGGTDHSDGQKRRYTGFSVKRVADVASHLEYDFATGWLYVADTGNARVLRLNAETCTPVKQIPSFGGDGKLYEMTAPVLQKLDAPPAGFQMPSGIAMYFSVLYVADAQSGKIHAFDVTKTSDEVKSPLDLVPFGKHLNTYDTGLGPKALGGIEVGPDRKLYFIDRQAGRVLRIDP